MWLKKIVAFIKRDFLTWKSYRLLFILNISGVFIPIFIFYFISKLFNVVDSAHLKEYGGEYFPFVFIGLVVNGYLLTALRGFSSKIRREQLLGTLEAVVATPTTPFLLILGLISWDFLIKWVNILIYILVGIFLFNLNFNLTQFLLILLILTLGAVSLSGLGIISASFILYFKKGDPIGWLGATLAGFLSGVYFPVELFPPILQKISNFIPLTYILRALRLSLLKGYSFNLLKNEIIASVLFSLILLPISIVVFNLALKKSLKEGMQIY